MTLQAEHREREEGGLEMALQRAQRGTEQSVIAGPKAPSALSVGEEPCSFALI